MTKISIVTSLYKSSEYINDFYYRHLKCIRELQLDYEFVFVNDASPDNSAVLVNELIAKDHKVKLILLSRNFGQYPAMFSGLAYADGDYIYATDSDLEEQPENIILMYKKITEENNIDVVYGVLHTRKGGIIRIVFGKLFYFILDILSDIRIPHNQAWQRIMNRKYVDALLQYTETETLPAGLMILTGFNQQAFLIDKFYKGASSYSFRKRLRLAINSITAFSSRPLVLIGIMGIFITSISFLVILITVIRKLFFVTYESGWISIIASIWLVGGFILSSVGIIGIYLAKIFNQVKKRPLFIIKDVIDNERK